MVMVKISKRYRITLPKKLVDKFKSEDFIKVHLKNGHRIGCFYVRIPAICPSRIYRQVRRKIPERLTKKLMIKQRDLIEIIKVEKIKKKVLPLFKNSKIDILSLNLYGIMAERFFRDKEEYVRFWQSSKCGGITKEIELKRFIKIDRKLGEFFGLMQAESRKSGYNFDFTNTLINEHKIFLEISDKYFGIQRNLWKFGIIHNNNIPKKKIDKEQKTFSKELNFNCIGYHTHSKTVLSYAYTIFINSKLLCMIMNKLLIKLREYPYKNKINNNFIEFYKGFIIKYLIGDGTVLLNKNLMNIEIILSEKDKCAQDDFISILKIFQIQAKAHGIKIDISTNLEACLWFLENEIFVGHQKNRYKFLKYILNNFYINVKFNRFKDIKNGFTAKEFSDKNKISYGAAQMFLCRNRKKGFLYSKKDYKNSKRTLFYLTKKTYHYLKIIKKAIYDYQPLIFNKGVREIILLDKPAFSIVSATS